MNTERRYRMDGDRAEAGSGRKASAQVILIPAQLRMQWTDLLALDRRLSDLAQRVACVIGFHLNRHRGDTYVTQDTIAALMGRTVRSVQRAIGELERAGYLLIERRELGLRKSDGRRVAGGKGVANTYAPAVDGQQVAITAAGLNLAERCADMAGRPSSAGAQRTTPVSSSEAPKDDTGDVLSAGIGRQESRPPEPQRTTLAAAKDDTGVVPTLVTIPSGSNPACAREAPAMAAGAAAAPPTPPRQRQRANHLGHAGAVLEDLLGKVDFRNWFGEVRVVGIEGETLTLSVPGNFQRDWIRDKFERSVIEAWRRAGISISLLAMEVRR